MHKSMTQEQVFEQVYEKYKDVFPDMKHGSGGLPDTNGEGTSDVDICLYSKDHAALASYFPKDTEIDSSSSGRTIYRLKGYGREVNIYCSDGDWWQNGFLHRKTELALNDQFPKLAIKARRLKKRSQQSTEATWAKILGLGDDYREVLLDTDKTLKLASQALRQKRPIAS